MVVCSATLSSLVARCASGAPHPVPRPAPRQQGRRLASACRRLSGALGGGAAPRRRLAGSADAGGLGRRRRLLCLGAPPRPAACAASAASRVEQAPDRRALRRGVAPALSVRKTIASSASKNESLISGVYAISPSRTLTMMSSSRCATSEISMSPTMRERALERVGVAQHLVDELAVARVALERDDALVQALEKLLRLFLELAYERAAVELDHAAVSFASGRRRLARRS